MLFVKEMKNNFTWVVQYHLMLWVVAVVVVIQYELDNDIIYMMMRINFLYIMKLTCILIHYKNNTTPTKWGNGVL